MSGRKPRWSGQQVHHVEAHDKKCGSCAGQLSACEGPSLSRLSAILLWTLQLNNRKGRHCTTPVRYHGEAPLVQVVASVPSIATHPEEENCVQEK